MLVLARGKYFFVTGSRTRRRPRSRIAGTVPFPSPAQSRTMGAVGDIRLLALSEILPVPKDGETMR
jgi:hypothetical protein